MVVAERSAMNGSDASEELDVLAHAFENSPNKLSATALELYMTQKCLTEGHGAATAMGIHAAFADY